MEQLGNGLSQINSIKTLVDGGARVTLDFGADSKELIKKLLDEKLDRTGLVVVAVVRADPNDAVNIKNEDDYL